MQKSNRDNFPKSVRDTVAKRVSFTCSRPGCTQPTVGPDTSSHRVVLLGEAAHIFAASPLGPRRVAGLTPQELRSVENAIWLCCRCAKLIDRDPEAFPVELLRRWKADAEAAVRARVHQVGTADRPSLDFPYAVPPHPDVFHPHTLRAGFTGRIRERQRLTRWWTHAGPPVRVLVGMGGLGKSSLAWVWKREDVLGTPAGGGVTKKSPGSRLRASERPDGVLWWSFYAPELQIQRSFELFVDRALVYLSGGKVPPSYAAPLEEKIHVLLGHLRTGRFLLILDGFERATKLYDHLTAPYEADLLDDDAAAGLRSCTDARAGQFLAGAAACDRSRLLVTSRVYPSDLDDLSAVERDDLAALEPDESREFFRALHVRGSDAEISAACVAASHHPLAVRLMAGYVLNTPGPYRGHIQALPDTPIELRPGERRRHIFETAYDGLSSEDQEFFGRVAIYTQAMSYDVLRASSPYGAGPELDRAVTDLEQRGFLSYDAERGTYDMHPLVRQYAYARIATADRVAGARQAYKYLSERLPLHETTLATLAMTLEVYRQAIRGGLIAQASEIFHHRLHPVLFFRVGRCHDQVHLLEELIAATDEWPGRLSDVQRGLLMVKLSTACNLTGFPREGYRWANAGAALLDEADPEGAMRANRAVYVASSAMRIGKLELAAELLESSMATHLRNADRFRAGIARLNLAWVLTYMGRFEEVDAHLDAASEIFEGPKTKHWQCILTIHRVRAALLAGSGERALASARQAHQLALDARNETNVVRAHWALGASLVRRAEVDASVRGAFLREAEGHLTEALRMCTDSGFGDFAMEVRVALAHWHAASGDVQSARREAEAALTLARAGGHALKEAEAGYLLSVLEPACSGDFPSPSAAHAVFGSTAGGDRVVLWALSHEHTTRPLQTS